MTTASLKTIYAEREEQLSCQHGVNYGPLGISTGQNDPLQKDKAPLAEGNIC